ncbi:MAG: 4-hydroxythreonine-4-phosphate dehydrogenase PdxA [Hyphomicrobiales bacterium]
MTSLQDPSPILLVTLGEPGSIGPELILKIWQERQTNGVPPFVYVANQDFIEKRATALGLTVPTCDWHNVSGTQQLNQIFNDTLPVINLNHTIHDEIGTADPKNGPAVIEAIETAVRLIHQGHADGLITAPINKKSLYNAGFAHPGHTEFLGKLANQWDGGPHRAVMMLAGPELRTVPATLHIPLKDVPEALDGDALIDLIQITNHELKHRFGIEKPRIVVTGLNPHAGEEGSMGHEDDAIIRPAIETAQSQGIVVSGPHPADTLFYRERRTTYDAAIAMYHDQALLPVKTIAFDETVNITLGLPFIRTSPDHGTALDIAGQGVARPNSMLAALKMTNEMARNAALDATMNQ